MLDIEQRIIDLLESGLPIDITSLGGVELILSEWETISRSRLADEFLIALVEYYSEQSFPPRFDLAAIFNKVISENIDPVVIRNTSLLLCKNAQILCGCFDMLLIQMSAYRDSFIRGQYLLAAFDIAILEKPKRYKLISFLLEKRENDDQDFLQYVVKILGIGYTYFENEDLLLMLEELDISLQQHDESQFELGMAYLKKGLSAQTRKDVVHLFTRASVHFLAAEKLGREDAACYCRVLSLLIDFDSDGDILKLTDWLSDLRVHLVAYASYHRYSSNVSWTLFREQELLNWFGLCNKITMLSEKLGPKGWLNPILIIEEYLLEIYCGNRMILKQNTAGGVDFLIKPTIVRRISDLQEKVSLLEQWIVNSKEHVSLHQAQQLIFEIEEYKTKLLSGNDQGATSKLLEDVVPAFKGLPVSSQNLFYDFVKLRQQYQVLKKDMDVEQVFNRVFASLSDANLVVNPEAYFQFQEIVFSTLSFLKHRMDGTVKNFPGLKYLFEGREVLEAKLQEDYFSYMNQQMFNCSITTEQMDIAGGRADVFFRFLDFHIVVEVKREKRRLTFEKLSEKYIGQTKEYQNTSTKLGLLLVLDLSDHSQGIGSLASNVYVSIYENKHMEDKRAIVIFRVPGNRLTPSSL